MADFRWILLGIGLLLLVGIWWWGARRSRRLPGDAQLREAATRPAVMGPTVMSAPPANTGDNQEAHDWGVPPFEPLNIRTAEFDPVQIADLPMTATADPLDVTLNMDYAEHEIATTAPPAFVERPAAEPEPWRESGAWPPAAQSTAIDPAYEPAATGRGYAEPTYAAADGEPAAIESDRRESGFVEPAVTNRAHLERTHAGPARMPHADSERNHANSTVAQLPAAADDAEAQRIVTLRVCAMEDSSWAGSDLFAVLEGHGLKLGRYKVFHRMHSDGRSLFCAASLVEPGTFDLARMPQQEFRGLTLFAVLPGPADALYTVDTLIGTAMQLAETLQGSVQDARGAPLSAQGVAALREDAARFPASTTS